MLEIFLWELTNTVIYNVFNEFERLGSAGGVCQEQLSGHNLEKRSESTFGCAGGLPGGLPRAPEKY